MLNAGQSVNVGPGGGVDVESRSGIRCRLLCSITQILAMSSESRGRCVYCRTDFRILILLLLWLSRPEFLP
jgi:hypothetical protein